jgi:Txe/YoeB family toxin of Txe-Axe toxin-antitoxin module
MYALVWDEVAKVELRSLRAFHRRNVLATVHDQLRHPPQLETSNREPLRQALVELPEGTWELRIRGAHRVFYRVEGRTVSILRVILKGTETIEDALRKGTRSWPAKHSP